VTRFPETLGIYESMLDMSICRGDLPSAKLAFRAISLFSEYPVDTLISVLAKTSLVHFSVLPYEIIRLDMDDAWAIISGMCEAALDKRAYAVASLFIRGVPDPITHNFMRSKASFGEYQSLISLHTYLDKVLYEVALSMGRIISDRNYFRYSGKPINEVESINNIDPVYYIGNKSWLFSYIVNYAAVISGISPEEVKSLITLLEHHYSAKFSYQELEYWQVLKEHTFKGNDMENLWKTSLRKKVLFQINEILETRLPILTPG